MTYGAREDEVFCLDGTVEKGEVSHCVSREQGRERSRTARLAVSLWPARRTRSKTGARGESEEVEQVGADAPYPASRPVWRPRRPRQGIRSRGFVQLTPIRYHHLRGSRRRSGSLRRRLCL